MSEIIIKKSEPTGFKVDHRVVCWSSDFGSLEKRDQMLASGMHGFETTMKASYNNETIKYGAFGTNNTDFAQHGIGMTYEVASTADGGVEDGNKNTWLRYIFYPIDSTGNEVQDGTRQGFVVSVHGAEQSRPNKYHSDEPLAVNYTGILQTDENGMPQHNENGYITGVVELNDAEVKRKIVDALKNMDSKKGE